MSTWDEPASACLSSRIPYGSEVTDEKLRQIERPRTLSAPSGSASSACGTTTAWPGSRSRADEMARALEPDVNERLVAALKAAGYQYVSLDLQGYRLGSLNEALRLRPVS